MIHQKMSGHLLYGKWKKRPGATKDKKWFSAVAGPLRDDPENSYIRLMIWLDNGHQLALSDLRRFGTIALDDDRDVASEKSLIGLGPEPLEISANDFAKLFKKKKGRLKSVLMDPGFIAGIGNIYADEILWRAGLHPLSRVERLKLFEIRAIHKHTLAVLRTAVARGGSSVDDYRTPSGEKGSFQNITRAYQRTGETCAKRDGGIIKRLVIGQRAAHFCPKHQKLRK